MAGSFSNYLENALLNHAFVGTPYTAPTTLYIGLYTVAPTDSGGGTEVSGGSYARVSAAPASVFNAASSGSIATQASINFATATGSWGTVVAFGIFDALTSGNLLAYGDLTTSKPITSGDTASFAIGSLTITLD